MRLATAHTPVALGPAHGPHEGGHHLRQGLALGQTGADAEAQAPQALCLCSSPPESYAAIERYLDLALKLVAKVRVVLGRAQ